MEAISYREDEVSSIIVDNNPGFGFAGPSESGSFTHDGNQPVNGHLKHGDPDLFISIKDRGGNETRR
jgi:hypothetical protein